MFNCTCSCFEFSTVKESFKIENSHPFWSAWLFQVTGPNRSKTAINLLIQVPNLCQEERGRGEERKGKERKELNVVSLSLSLFLVFYYQFSQTECSSRSSHTEPVTLHVMTSPPLGFSTVPSPPPPLSSSTPASTTSPWRS